MSLQQLNNTQRKIALRTPTAATETSRMACLHAAQEHRLNKLAIVQNKHVENAHTETLTT